MSNPARCRGQRGLLAGIVASLAVCGVISGCSNGQMGGADAPGDPDAAGAASDGAGAGTVTTTSAPSAPSVPPGTSETPDTSEPPSTVVPTTAPGRAGVFVPAPGTSPVVGTGPLMTYSVAVEEVLGLDPLQVAAVVDRTLANPRSWTTDGSVSFQRVHAAADIEIVVASPPAVDRRCLPLNTAGVYSCRSGSTVNINSDRWMGATADWSIGIDAYRSYVVNHEVGHALGHGHESCPGAGSLAPVMMQQTKGLGSCTPNPWPFP